MSNMREIALEDKSRHSNGVSGGMFIYLITNLINGKQYIGRSIRKDPRRRWSEHRKDGTKPASQMVLHRAMRKHGIENFTFKVIETLEDPNRLAEREGHYIRHYDTLAPKGYNVETYQPHAIKSEETRRKSSIGNQGKSKSSKKTSQYVGVYRHPYGWMMLVTKDGVDHCKVYKAEIDAARAYDMMALRLYGETAKTNMPSTDYSQREIEATYEYVMVETKTSRFKGVDFVSSTGFWRGVVQVPGTTRVRITGDEIEAAEFVDVVRWVYFSAPATEMNFPDKHHLYAQLDMAWLDRRLPHASLDKGICRTRSGRFAARFGPGGCYYCGVFDTKEKAHEARLVRMEKEDVLWRL